MTERSFLTRLFVVVLVGLFLALFWVAAEVFFLLFFSILLAIILRTFSKPLARRTRLSDRASVVTVTLVLLVSLVAAGFVLLPRITEQAEQFVAQVPRIVTEVQVFVAGMPLGQAALERLPIPDGLRVDPEGNAATNGQRDESATAISMSRAASAVSTTFDLMFLALFVVFASFFLALRPDLYRSGVLLLVPKDRRERARHVIDVTVQTLRLWLLGRLVSMVAVGALITAGLWLLDVPLALFLGVLAGLLDFIPLIGPWLAAVPAVMFAFVEDPMLGVYVALLYTVVQQIETYAVTPLAQQWAVHLPPVLTIFVLLLMHLIFGVIGALVATPLTAAGMVVVKMLYVEDVLKDDVEIQAEQRT